MQFEIIDLFAGAGGVTSGFEDAEIDGEKICKVIAAVNHDKLAIESHKANHPETIHFIEDIRTLDVTKLPAFTRSPDIITAIWASLECTNFSKAKGGQSREADSRTLADHMPRYIIQSNPNYIFIENVREFMTWGPLIQKTDGWGDLMFNKDGSPIMIPDPKHKGEDYERWIKEICSLGYRYKYRLLNAADYGAYTSRVRYFGVFAQEGFPIVFPQPSHDKTGRNGLTKWNAVKEKLDLKNYGKSIFNRKKSLSIKTLNRISYGINKYCFDGRAEDIVKFLISYYGQSKKAHSVEEPVGTISTKDRYALVSAEKNDDQFLMEFYGRDTAVTPIEKPAKTISTHNRMALVSVDQFVTTHMHNNPAMNKSIDEPARTITTKAAQNLVSVELDNNKKQFLSQNIWGNEKANTSIKSPAPAILTEDEKSLVSVELEPKQFISKYFTCSNPASDIEEPLSSITTVDHNAMVTVEQEQFLQHYYSGGGQLSEVDEPHPAVLSTPKSSLVTIEKEKQFIDKQYSGPTNVSSIEEPLGSITSNPKASLITILKNAGIIKDIKMRMLTIQELKEITGFKPNYILMGNQTNQKKFIGNAVVPVVPQKWALALHYELIKQLSSERAA